MGILEIVIVLAIFVLLCIPAGKYVYKVTEHKKTFLDPVFDCSSFSSITTEFHLSFRQKQSQTAYCHQFLHKKSARLNLLNRAVHIYVILLSFSFMSRVFHIFIAIKIASFFLSYCNKGVLSRLR